MSILIYLSWRTRWGWCCVVQPPFSVALNVMHNVSSVRAACFRDAPVKYCYYWKLMAWCGISYTSTLSLFRKANLHMLTPLLTKTIYSLLCCHYSWCISCLGVVFTNFLVFTYLLVLFSNCLFLMILHCSAQSGGKVEGKKLAQVTMLA